MKQFFIILLLASQPLIGILPPFYQSQSEIEAILEDEDLQECLGTTRQINSIVRNDKGWIVSNDLYEVQVVIKYEYDGKLGPANFNITFDCPHKVHKNAQ